MNGRFTRLTMKPGVSAHSTAVLPQRRDQRLGADDGAGSVAGAGDDLDERHQRRRVEEMKPEHTRRAGLSPRRSRRPTVRSYSWRGALRRSRRCRAHGRSPASPRDPRARLRSRAPSPRRRPRSKARRRSNAMRPATQSSVESASRSRRLARRSRPLRMRARPRSIASGLDVVEQELVACLDGELGDPGAHGAGTDDADRADGHPLRRASSLRTAGGSRGSSRASGTASDRTPSP